MYKPFRSLPAHSITCGSLTSPSVVILQLAGPAAMQIQRVPGLEGFHNLGGRCLVTAKGVRHLGRSEGLATGAGRD
jgi:hypothetical protein